VAKSFNVHAARNQLSRLLDRAHAGEEIVIAKNGQPYARLVPLEHPRPRRPGLLKGKVDDAALGPLTDDDLEAWER
jgi:prevent-host-death family protein